jgi:hypothetical protein
MPLALKSSGLTPCDPSLPGEWVTVSTHLAHREQRRTSTRGGVGSVIVATMRRKVEDEEGEDNDEDEDDEVEEVEDSEEVRCA